MSKKFRRKIPASAKVKVDRIAGQAIALGWSRARLYGDSGRFRFPCGEGWGLVCFLGKGRRIGRVTRQFIEIIGPPPRSIVNRFYNPDVDQPWIRVSG